MRSLANSQAFFHIANFKEAIILIKTVALHLIFLRSKLINYRTAVLLCDNFSLFCTGLEMVDL